VANGGKVLGSEVEAYEVLYLALEDTEQRVQERLLRQGAPCSDQLHIYDRWTKDEAKFDLLGRWLGEHPGVRLVIIDTLVKFSSWQQGNYNADSQHIDKFKNLAARHKISFILVHHQRKTAAKDECDLVLGSNALFGTVDALLSLYRQRSQADATLSIIGRDLKETAIPLKFAAQNCTWEVREPGEGDNLTPERQEIVKLLQGSGPLKLQDIAARLDKKKSNIANLVAKLTQQGVVEKVSYGKYQIKNSIR
jgi:RecA-family ATPase